MGGWKNSSEGRPSFAAATRLSPAEQAAEQAAIVARSARLMRVTARWVDEQFPGSRDEHGHPDPFLVGAALVLRSVHGQGRVTREMVAARAEQGRRRLDSSKEEKAS